MRVDKSGLTARGRKAPSVPMRRLHKANRLNGRNMLDYGCGRGFDADHYGMDKHDLHHFNRGDLCNNDYDVITCNYVVNTIESSYQKIALLDHIKALLTPNGIAYITIRRDVKAEGYTSKGTYQQNTVLGLPVLWENKQYCTYILTK